MTATASLSDLADACLNVGLAVDENPGLFYEPGPTLSRFIYEDVPRKLARCANQVGKTLAGAKQADLASRGELPTVTRTPNRGLVMIADLDNHYAEVCEKIWAVIDRAALHPDCKYTPGKGIYTHGKRLVKYADGSTWTFRSGKGEVMAIAGGTYDWGWVDEVPKRGHFSEFMRGMAANNAPVWMTFTPIGRPVGWFRDRVEGDIEFRASLESGLDPESCPGTAPREEWHQYTVSLSVEECPWRSADSIESQIAGMDPAEVPQRRDGAWEGLAPDRYFTGFGAESIVDSVPRMSAVQFGVWMDHGENAGREWALLAVWKPGALYIIDEYVNPNPTNAAQDAQGIHDMLCRHDLEWHDIDSWVGDTNSGGKNSRAGESVNDLISDALGQITHHPPGQSPIRIDRPYKGPGSVEKRVRILHSAFLRRQLFIHKRCRQTIAAVGSHHGDEDTKHAVDALGYGAVPVLEEWRRPGAKTLWLRGR